MRYLMELHHQNVRKNLTISPNWSMQELSAMIGSSFGLQEKVVGLSDKFGKFYTLQEVINKLSVLQKHIHFLVTCPVFGQNRLSFGEIQRLSKNKNDEKMNKKNQMKQSQISCLPQYNKQGCLGIIGDLQLFEDIFLQQEQKIVVVNCFTKDKYPQDVLFSHYIYQTDKNSTIIYLGRKKLCEFYTDQWSTHSPKEVYDFIQSLNPKKQQNIQLENDKNQQMQDLPLETNNDAIQRNSQDQDLKNIELKQCLLQGLEKLYEQENIDEVQYYKLKLMALQKPQQFIRKYQMNTRKGYRDNQNNKFDENIRNYKKNQKCKVERKQHKIEAQNISQQHNLEYYQNPSSTIVGGGGDGSQEQHRNKNIKKYQIPIIVRKNNNVIEKISTSYPLSVQQEQFINLIMQLQLKGLISEKQSVIYKSLILQEESEIFQMFIEYFNDFTDQIQLANRLKKFHKKNRNRNTIYRKNSFESQERKEQNMRFLIKNARQKDYELLRNLLIERNHYIINCFEKYREDRKSDELSYKLEKIANLFRIQEQLQLGLKYE